MCLCSCVWRWVYQFSSHLPLIPPSPTPLQCAPTGLSSCMLSHTHTHTHTHSFPHTLPPVASSVCVCRHQTQGLIISAPTPLSSSYFLYSSSPASLLLFIHFVHSCPPMSHEGQLSFLFRSSHVQNAVWTQPSPGRLNCSFVSVCIFIEPPHWLLSVFS